MVKTELTACTQVGVYSLITGRLQHCSNIVRTCIMREWEILFTFFFFFFQCFLCLNLVIEVIKLWFLLRERNMCIVTSRSDVYCSSHVWYEIGLNRHTRQLRDLQCTSFLLYHNRFLFRLPFKKYVISWL